MAQASQALPHAGSGDGKAWLRVQGVLVLPASSDRGTSPYPRSEQAVRGFPCTPECDLFWRQQGSERRFCHGQRLCPSFLAGFVGPVASLPALA